MRSKTFCSRLTGFRYAYRGCTSPSTGLTSYLDVDYVLVKDRMMIETSLMLG